MYHEPCHVPMQTMPGIKVVNALMGQKVDLSDRCCGESGTLAVTRPDISTQVRFRKQEEIETGADRLRADGSVSYTHLDVYKRQARLRVTAVKSGWLGHA